MADIQMVKAYLHLDRYIMVDRTFDGFLIKYRMPKEVLSMIGAEYNLEPDDPFVLEMLMFRDLYKPDVMEDKHPLHWADTIEEAVDAMQERVEWVRNEHNAPAAPNRMLAQAVDNGIASEGLVDAQSLLLQNIDQRIVEPVQFYRDAARQAKKEQGKVRRPSLAEELHASMNRIRATTVPVAQRRPAMGKEVQSAD